MMRQRYAIAALALCTMGPVVLNRRDALRGVVLGDGMTGDERDSYHFGNGVDI